MTLKKRLSTAAFAALVVGISGCGDGLITPKTAGGPQPIAGQAYTGAPHSARQVFEQEIENIEKNSNMPADAKAKAVAALQQRMATLPN